MFPQILNSQTYNQLLDNLKKISSHQEEEAFEEKLRLEIFQQPTQDDQAQIDFLVKKIS